jgi:hypothetical protein
LEAIGSGALDVILKDMKSRGFRFQADAFYSLREIYEYFSDILGREMAEIVIDGIMRNMRSDT